MSRGGYTSCRPELPVGSVGQSESSVLAAFLTFKSQTFLSVRAFI